MRKIVYLCVMMLLSMDMMAQIDLDHGNWDTVFYDDFSSVRIWDTVSWYSLPDQHWKAYPGHQITHGKRESQIYQYDHCVFDCNDSVICLVSEFDYQDLIPRHEYHLPNVMNGVFPNPLGIHNKLFFFSGEIDIRSTTFGFGYFEIKCKLPLHKGSFPAFWLFGGGPNSYEEIDIFEYSKGDCEGDTLRGYSSGIWHNPVSYHLYDTVNGVSGDNYAKVHHHLPISSPDLGQYHTFGCEWMPDYVKWYRDGNVVSEYYDTSHIPLYPKTLKINYAILFPYLQIDSINNVIYGWSGTDTMTINYVKVLRLKTDCDTDEYITTGAQFANYDGCLKNSITIGSSNGQVIVPSDTNVSMLAEKFIVIDGEFELSSGSEMTLSTRKCPRSNLEIDKTIYTQ